MNEYVVRMGQFKGSHKIRNMDLDAKKMTHSLQYCISTKASLKEEGNGGKKRTVD